MNITLQYFEGCPNWERADAAMRKVLDDLGVEPQIKYQLIDTPEAAERLQFRGSPTILLDGVDPFAQPDAPVGLSCRVYRTQAGLAGSPSEAQLRTALETRAGGIRSLKSQRRPHPNLPVISVETQVSIEIVEEPTCPTPSTQPY
jgi:hypothetical protein